MKIIFQFAGCGRIWVSLGPRHKCLQKIDSRGFDSSNSFPRFLGTHLRAHRRFRRRAFFGHLGRCQGEGDVDSAAVVGMGGHPLRGLADHPE